MTTAGDIRGQIGAARFAWISATAGTTIWLGACWILQLPLEATSLLFAPLALVPLGLELLESPANALQETLLLAWIKRLQLPAAALLAVSFGWTPGVLAAIWATPWLAVTSLLALLGGLRLWRMRWQVSGTGAVTAALLFVLIGGGWAVISRAGMRPQNFSHTIVLLTGVHFHYAGFVLPLLAARAVGNIRNPSQKNYHRRRDGLMLFLILGGVPAVGVGISLSKPIELIAAIALAGGCLLLAWRQAEVAWADKQPMPLTLAAISSLSLVSAMALAAIYAVGHFWGKEWLDIPAMIRTHGAFNAFGFAACGLAGQLVSRR